ncbi:hypothetical protein FE257_005859 [Aspergillus nanangensis]|uniref:Uncharacterized protein n=1 Tax=Aspergillus nanangensis TaxID=2582783 RepID=A0AAD4CPU5_ASPNN|nr:hypothetical protein FE257_005859 [Aspergillus nanangensis]
MPRNNRPAARTGIRRLFRRREVHLLSETQLHDEKSSLMQEIASVERQIAKHRRRIQEVEGEQLRRETPNK